ncbi:T9SS type A sorting domain-containing protein [Flavobacterium jejuense]|uniref:T9SS type A sorting domain-containing protein n=1 Tax=Flavobacterium jejuense TaxID=1544455 RepID=A0ABX0ISQ7_9FLAO|nr:T9SS type A sorting domain-containing protein [Flavobacterium jejuense]NHN26879.1 T9SS type A sorting domain-containing protein [Flavobacterium jejuense]
MKKLFKVLLLCYSIVATAQSLQKPPHFLIEKAPEWAKMMYDDNPNVYSVDAAYNAYYREHDFEKNIHTQYYKSWKRSIMDLIAPDGSIKDRNREEIKKYNQISSRTETAALLNGDWTLIGPIETHGVDDGAIDNQQCNVYCIDQSLSNPNIVYCGTEPGEVYKSLDGGDNWFNVSLNVAFSNRGVNAIEIDPTNPDIVYVGNDNLIYKTSDGGVNWQQVFADINYPGNGIISEIVVHLTQTNIIFMAGYGGLYRSIDNGNTWNRLFNSFCYDIKVNTADPTIIYLLKKNNTLNICEFLKSTNSGQTFAVQSTGWYTSSNPNRNVDGGRLAVSQADPNRVYAHLIGHSKATDYGFIGLYKSTDGGTTWTLPNGPIGAPYTANHVNLAASNPDGGGIYQDFYNCALLASNTDPDKLLIGGINLWSSNDGGETFTLLAGYSGTAPFPNSILHVDMQDFRQIGNTTWITNDGGIVKSSDFFSTSNFETKMKGVHSTDFWGFGSGWNEDILYGGAYHNGVKAFYENYGLGNVLNTGGGEPASGYVNPGENKRVYSTQVGGRILPQNIGDPITNVGFGIQPNESYWTNSSSELEFDPRCYAVAYTGKDNQIWKTEDKGNTFSLLETFGTDVNDKITNIEVFRSNPNIIYVCQQLPSLSLSIIWKTIDGGQTWSSMNMPNGNFGVFINIQADAIDPDKIWLTYGNLPRIFKTIDGGSTWTNMATPTIQNHFFHGISLLGNSSGGIYLFTNKSVFYRNDSMPDWIDFSNGLPLKTSVCKGIPFYRDGKIRIATYGKGVWESPLYEPQTAPLAQIMVDKLVQSNSVCDTYSAYHFVDYSMLNHENATWLWTFEGGIPATATTWQADVIFNTPGEHIVTLTVTDANGQSDTDTLTINTLQQLAIIPPLIEDFQAVFPPNGFEIVNPDVNLTWELNETVGGYGLSDRCIYINAYNSTAGQTDDIKIFVDMTNYENASLNFDVAYAIWGSINYEGLEVLVSTDCGVTFQSLYFKESDQLATAPSNPTTVFVPTATQWRTETIDLSNYQGFDKVLLLFRVHEGYGQNLYIDNINVNGTPILSTTNPINEEKTLLLYPNPVRPDNLVHLFSNLDEAISVEVFSIDGKRVYKSTHQNNDELTIKNLASGNYVYVLSSSRLIKKGKLIVQ